MEIVLKMQYWLHLNTHTRSDICFQFARELKMRQMLLVIFYLSAYNINNMYTVITYVGKYFYIEALTGLSSLLWFAEPEN